MHVVSTVSSLRFSQLLFHVPRLHPAPAIVSVIVIRVVGLGDPTARCLSFAMMSTAARPAG